MTQFCAEPLTAFTDRDALFPVVPGALSDEDLHSLLSRISQLIQDLHEDPRSFPLRAASIRCLVLVLPLLPATPTTFARICVRQ